MKISYRLFLIASLLGVLYVIGCGNNGNNANCGAGYQSVNNQCVSTSQYLQNGGSCQGSCAVGQVQTSLGCLTAASQCGACAGMNPSTQQCVQAIQTGSTGYGTTGYGTTGYGYGTTGYGTTGYGTSGYGYGSSYGYPYGYGSTGYGYGSSYPYYH